MAFSTSGQAQERRFRGLGLGLGLAIPWTVGRWERPLDQLKLLSNPMSKGGGKQS
jgi:hypothetical protein